MTPICNMDVRIHGCFLRTTLSGGYKTRILPDRGILVENWSPFQHRFMGHPRVPDITVLLF
jgi:hypothetical protein